MLNSEACSNYPSEGEMLFAEGTEFLIVDYEDNFMFKNEHKNFD